jgi:ATP-dependent helicase/nuclease subunit A
MRCAGVKLTDAACVAEARRRVQQEAEHEYRRLLYVGMTRAAERLIVCGAQGKQRLPEGCWWTLVTNALIPLSTEEADEDGSKLWRFTPKPQARIDAPSPSTQPITNAERPLWLDHTVAAPSIPPRPISPPRSLPLARGILMHRLLQSLPDLAPEIRRHAAREYFSRRAREFTREECESMGEQVCGLLEKAEFSELFGKSSRAEVPIVGRLRMDGRMIPVSGQVDRLAVFGDAVLIGDYKTDRPAPRVLDDVPGTYIRQLALYRAVLRRLYPDKRVRAALLWTDVPDLMEIPASVLDAAINSPAKSGAGSPGYRFALSGLQGMA